MLFILYTFDEYQEFLIPPAKQRGNLESSFKTLEWQSARQGTEHPLLELAGLIERHIHSR